MKKFISIATMASTVVMMAGLAFMPVTAQATADVQLSFLSKLQGSGAPNYLGSPSTIILDGSYAYVMNVGTDVGLTVVNISNPSAPSYVSHLAFNGGGLEMKPSLRMAKSGNYIFVAAGYSGVWAIDVSNPAAPVSRNFIVTNGARTFSRGMVSDGTHLYVMNQFSEAEGMRIVDISNPQSPVLLGFVPISGGFDMGGMDIEGSTVYYIDAITNLRAIDVSDPSAPAIVSTVPAVGITQSLVAVGNYVYFVTSGVLKVYDVSDPASPKMAGSFPAPAYGVWDWARLDATTLVATLLADPNAVVALDISDPSTPVFGTPISGPGAPNYLAGASGVAVQGGKVFVGAYLDSSFTILNPSSGPIPPGEVIDTVHDGVLKLGPGQNAVLRPPAVLNGGLAGSGDNTITIDGNVQADGSVKNILNLHLTAGSTLTITGGLEIRGTLIIDAGANLVVGGKFTCPGATDITNKGSADIGNNQCVQLVAKAGGLGVGTILAVIGLSLVAGLGFGVFMKTRGK